MAILGGVPEIAVIGPGAVGATFAAAAERAGHDVALCGRRAGPAPVVEGPGGKRHALAGPARAESEDGYLGKGSTGVAVRTLLSWLERRSSRA